MKTRLLLSSLLIALSATSFAQTHKAHWSYNGKESPEHWGDLLTEYQTCKLGKVQSPVNLEADNSMKVANKPLKMNYFPAAYQVETMTYMCKSVLHKKMHHLLRSTINHFI